MENIESPQNSLVNTSASSQFESQVFFRISEALVETIELEEMLQLIVDASLKIFPEAEKTILHLYDETKEVLYPSARSSKKTDSDFKFPLLTITPTGNLIFNPIHDLDSKINFMQFGKGGAGQAIKTKKVVNIPNTREDPRYIISNEQETTASMLIAPIFLEERILGTISVNSPTTNTFSANDELLIQQFSNQAALALKNAQLYAAEQNQRQLSEALAEAASALGQSLNLDTVLDIILDQTLKVVPYRATNLVILTGDQEESIRERYRGYPQSENFQIFRDAFETLESLPKFLVEQVINSQKACLIGDTTISTLWETVPGFEWVRSLASVPILHHGQVVGVMTVGSELPHFFNEDSISRLQALASHAAVAIHNAHLYTDLQKALENERRIRSRLVQADKLVAMGRMIASVAHELNNPLQTIKNCLYLIQQSGSGDQKENEFLFMALEETQRLSDLVLRLRKVYRPTQSKEVINVDLQLVLQEIYLLLEPHLRRNDVRWVQKPLDTATTVPGIPDQLKQVFMNISFNAIEAMQPNGGTITTSLVEDKATKRVGIRFQDSGPGISPENLRNLFDPFFTTKDTGTGLGLSICFEIIQSHNGSIEVSSQKGNGALFTIWLPMEQPRD